MRHYASNCVNPGNGEVILLKLAYAFTQHFGDIIKHSWVLLDTCSTICVGSNEEHFVSIRKCTPNERICVRTNEGSIFLTRLKNSNYFL